MTATQKTGARPTRAVPPNVPDQKTISAGERPETATTSFSSSSGRKPWKKKTVAEQILGQLDKLRADVAEKERDYLQAKKQLDKLEELRAVLENQ
jgi:predicted patatin/cPLA2 family phospholipase